MSLPQKELYDEDDYYSIPEDVRAELIDGRIYYQAAPNRVHQKVLNILNNMIYNYIRSHNGLCEVYPVPFAVKLYEDRKTIVEPDISIICDHEKLTDKGCNGAPDWIIEIVSPSNPENDYIRKLNLYKNAGVREYWIVNPMKQTVLVYVFGVGLFDIQQYTFQDKVKVGIYEDLYIDFMELDLR